MSLTPRNSRAGDGAQGVMVHIDKIEDTNAVGNRFATQCMGIKQHGFVRCRKVGGKLSGVLLREAARRAHHETPT
jgi:hypothetical protein